MAAHGTTPICPDWIFLDNSNVHVAKDRGWFMTYTPFNSYIKSSLFCSPRYLPVLGVGTVRIPTKCSSTQSGISNHSYLRLEQVLHVPGFICNVISSSVMISDGYNIQKHVSRRSKGAVKDRSGKQIAFFNRNTPHYSIRVRSRPEGPRLGPHVLRKNGMYMISCYWVHNGEQKCHWEQSEEQKWLDYKAGDCDKYSKSVSAIATGTSSSDTNANPPYTKAEKRFLEDSCDGEYEFLFNHGLDFYNSEDRERSRLLLRALMRREGLDGECADEEESDDEEEEEEEEEDEEESNNEEEGSNYSFDDAELYDPAEFSSEELKWVRTHYRDVDAFMAAYGLNPNWFYDRMDARGMVNGLLKEEKLANAVDE
ncbi:hypothetical protein COCMIDRAFT_81932 [Bipolaris oryzae ATCC 44560]|uniref:Retrovirus-related Pol polyprotein from transposon TNT 1-94-like beta-barrel domain-containing protein n=1 Tax=Bipolaris oryzae ATCC 44560 TaxID=930090 RepID=W6ZSE4_COCMI|nr:uncharacterized protein COCMIDRAFT_81932 [Bipolaris oryzae ATCC 44560]EUC50434.1 hypothetical protein COCMIDRAFT_81932 [Bipolaris oryzae ATCC 44560]